MANPYSHAYSFSFAVASNDPDGADVTGAQLREALLTRLSVLSDDELLGTCDAPFDTFQEDEE